MTLSQLTALLWGTVVYRPYVYAFLAVFVVFAVLHLGAARTLTFALPTWVLAFAAEYSSTRNGFPFGFYRYFDDTRGRELWISNVPFWDSLSFVFLSYFSFALAAAMLTPASARSRGRWRGVGHPAAPLLGGVLMMLLDVVIDPVTLLGDRWFLGRIYDYPSPGFYFGVTAANFAGWFVVGAASQYVFQAALAALPWCRGEWRRLHSSFAWLILTVYACVFLFVLGITLWVAGPALSVASSAVALCTVAFAASRLRGPAPGSIVVCAATATEADACAEGIADAGVDDVEVLRTGVGPERAARALRERLAASPRPRLVVSSGFAGALTPGMERGSFVTADEVHELAGGAVVPVLTGGGLLRIAPASVAVAIVSAPGILQASPLPAGRAAAADMESAALARVAAEAGVPFAVFRMISDAPSTPLPELARSAAAALAADGAGARLAAALGVVANALRAPRDAAALARYGVQWKRQLRGGWRDRANDFKRPLPASTRTGSEAAEG